MAALRPLAITALILGFSGCVNLKEVREFAAESARFSGYADLTERFRTTYAREQPYLVGPAAAPARDNDRARRSAHRDLLQLQRTLAQYFQTLAQLAGDKTFEPAKGLETRLQPHPELGLDPRHAEACAKLALVTEKWITSGRQVRAVRRMLREGDPHLQTLLEGMSTLVSLYRRTHENERRTVTGLLEVELTFAEEPQDLLLATLAKAHLQSKNREYELAASTYAEAAKGIQALREGHHRLAEDAERLSTAEARAAIQKFTKDLRGVRTSLDAVHAW